RGGYLMLHALRRLGVLSACCLTLFGGEALAKEVAVIHPYQQSESSSVLHERLAAAAPDLDRRGLGTAIGASQCAVAGGARPAERLAVIDFSLPSTEQRLWSFDLKHCRLLLQDVVGDGQGSGGSYARQFCNVEGSHQSSTGQFRTQESY